MHVQDVNELYQEGLVIEVVQDEGKQMRWQIMHHCAEREHIHNNCTI